MKITSNAATFLYMVVFGRSNMVSCIFFIVIVLSCPNSTVSSFLLRNIFGSLWLQAALGKKCISGEFGDPHIITFDRLGFDCQGAGEFVMVKSLEDPSFQVQERFTAIENSAVCSQTSVSTGVVIQDANTPKIQLSTPRNGQSSLNIFSNTCQIDFYVDGVETLLPGVLDTGGGATYHGSDVFEDEFVNSPGHVYVTRHDVEWDSWTWVHIRHAYTDVEVQVR